MHSEYHHTNSPTCLRTHVVLLGEDGLIFAIDNFGGDAEVDLSSSYFNFQIKGLFEKKNITIKAFAFDSP
jgi:hypothetical protein